MQLSIDEYRQKLYELIVSKKTHIRRIQHDGSHIAQQRMKSRSYNDVKSAVQNAVTYAHNLNNNHILKPSHGYDVLQTDPHRAAINAAQQQMMANGSAGKPPPMAEAECSDTDVDSVARRKSLGVLQPSVSQVTLTADNIKYGAANGIDVMSHEYKSLDQYTPMAVQPQVVAAQRSNSVDARQSSNLRPISGQAFNDLMYTNQRPAASSQQPQQQQSQHHKFWNGKTSKLFRSISRGRDKSASGNNNVGTSKDVGATVTIAPTSRSSPYCASIIEQCPRRRPPMRWAWRRIALCSRCIPQCPSRRNTARSRPVVCRHYRVISSTRCRRSD